jgi:hypothetical protein
MTYSDALWENTPGDVGVTWPSVISGSHGTTILHFVLLLRKRREKKPGMCRTYFRSGPHPVTLVWRHIRSIGPTRRTYLRFRALDWHHFRSGHVTSLLVAPAHAITSGRTTSQQHLKIYLNCTHILLGTFRLYLTAPLPITLLTWLTSLPVKMLH